MSTAPAITPAVWEDFDVPAHARGGQVTLNLYDHLAAYAPKRPGAYLRISSDRFGLEAGVDRQLEDAEDTRARLRWGPFAKIYRENDTSAFKKRKVIKPDGSIDWIVLRPEFRQLLADLAHGVIDGVIFYDLDRLVRQPRDLEDLIDIVEYVKRPVTGACRTPAPCPGTHHGALPPLTDQVIRMPAVRPRLQDGARARSSASRAGTRAPPLGAVLMPTTDPHALDPAADFLIAPVYLAGPGPGHAVFNILDSAAGWTKVVAFGEDTYYTSPCQRVRMANVMDSHYGGWTISYAEDPLGVPDWITTFDRDTPREIVAAFTDTLVAGLPNHFADYLSGGKRHTGLTPATVFSQHEWEAIRGTRPFRTVSPDGHAAFRIRGGWLREYDELLHPEKSTWRMSAGPDPIAAPSWQAYFSGYTPEHLMTAAANALTDPRPVVRAEFLIPDRHRSLVKTQPLHPDQTTSLSTTALARSSRTSAVHHLQPPPAASAPLPPVVAGSRRQR